MKIIMIKRIIIFAFVFPLFFLSVNAQTDDLWLVSFYGHEFKNDKYQISSSAGELVIETLESNNFILTQGFHQTFDIGTIVEEIKTDLELKVHPNPFTDIFILKFSSEIPEAIGSTEIVITDLSGRLIHHENPELQPFAQHVINTEKWITGFYFLTIRFQKLNSERTFKLVKK